VWHQAQAFGRLRADQADRGAGVDREPELDRAAVGEDYRQAGAGGLQDQLVAGRLEREQRRRTGEQQNRKMPKA
jgi:hypothetical protein